MQQNSPTSYVDIINFGKQKSQEVITKKNYKQLEEEAAIYKAYVAMLFRLGPQTSRSLELAQNLSVSQAFIHIARFARYSDEII